MIYFPVVPLILPSVRVSEARGICGQTPRRTPDRPEHVTGVSPDCPKALSGSPRLATVAVGGPSRYRPVTVPVLVQNYIVRVTGLTGACDDWSGVVPGWSRSCSGTVTGSARDCPGDSPAATGENSQEGPGPSPGLSRGRPAGDRWLSGDDNPQRPGGGRVCSRADLGILRGSSRASSGPSWTCPGTGPGSCRDCPEPVPDTRAESSRNFTGVGHGTGSLGGGVIVAMVSPGLDWRAGQAGCSSPAA